MLAGEVVRHFQPMGLAPALEAVRQPPRERDIVWFTNSRREQIFEAELSPIGDSFWRDAAFIDQPEFDRWLRDTALAQPQVALRLGVEVTRFSERNDVVSVEARNRSSGEPESCSADWLIGCDGSTSFVRRQLGIGWESLGYDCEWLVLDTAPAVLVRPDRYIFGVADGIVSATALVEALASGMGID